MGGGDLLLLITTVFIYFVNN